MKMKRFPNKLIISLKNGKALTYIRNSKHNKSIIHVIFLIRWILSAPVIWTTYNYIYQVIFPAYSWNDVYYAMCYRNANISGNDKIHALSKDTDALLYIEMTDYTDTTRYVAYEDFGIDDESSGYRIHIGQHGGTDGRNIYTQVF